jgi:hypothetical protein
MSTPDVTSKKPPEDENIQQHFMVKSIFCMLVGGWRNSLREGVKSGWRAVREIDGRVEMSFYTCFATVVGGTLGCVCGVCCC